MNFHSDEWIMDRVREHYNEALEYFPEDRIVGIYYQGSGNYGLDYPDSDVDTKLIVTPTFEDIAMNKKAVSTTHIRANEEHIDFKDIRLYIQTFRKQNLNFLEILFTKYAIINPVYKAEWYRLVEARETIAHYAPVQAIKSMKGIAKEKYHAMEHHYPARMAWIEKFGYDPKQLHHLIRVNEYISRYIDGESYEACLQSRMPDYLQAVKKGFHNLDEARMIGTWAIQCIDKMCDEYLKNCSAEVDQDVDALLDDVQYNIMKIAIKKEIGD
jgi:predicted nucleotidyltransferase